LGVVGGLGGGGGGGVVGGGGGGGGVGAWLLCSECCHFAGYS